jgi:hypothetical protein
MSAPTSILAYDDCFDLMNQALEDPAGIRVKFGNDGDATHFRIRLNKARALMREQNKSVYGPDEPMHGKSTYDPLVFRVKRVDGDWYVYLQANAYSKLTVESLSEVEDKPADKIEPEPGPSINRRV